MDIRFRNLVQNGASWKSKTITIYNYKWFHIFRFVFSSVPISSLNANLEFDENRLLTYFASSYHNVSTVFAQYLPGAKMYWLELFGIFYPSSKIFRKFVEIVRKKWRFLSFVLFSSCFWLDLILFCVLLLVFIGNLLQFYFFTVNWWSNENVTFSPTWLLNYFQI